jgi:hypothetical protein
VAPPPPPAAAVVHSQKAKPKRVKRAPKATKKLTGAAVRRTPPRRPDPQLASTRTLAAAPVAGGSGSGGATSPTFLLGLVGLLLAFVGVAISLVPVWSVPIGVGVRIERNRQTIALTGLAIGVACAFVGFLDFFSGG